MESKDYLVFEIWDLEFIFIPLFSESSESL